MDIQAERAKMIASAHAHIEKCNALMLHLNQCSIADKEYIVRNPDGNVCIAYETNWVTGECHSSRSTNVLNATRFLDRAKAQRLASVTRNGNNILCEVVLLSAALNESIQDQGKLINMLEQAANA